MGERSPLERIRVDALYRQQTVDQSDSENDAVRVALALPAAETTIDDARHHYWVSQGPQQRSAIISVPDATFRWLFSRNSHQLFFYPLVSTEFKE